jgi:hypothetical protein
MSLIKIILIVLITNRMTLSIMTIYKMIRCYHFISPYNCQNIFFRLSRFLFSDERNNSHSLGHFKSFLSFCCSTRLFVQQVCFFSLSFKCTRKSIFFRIDDHVEQQNNKSNWVTIIPSIPIMKSCYKKIHWIMRKLRMYKFIHLKSILH